MKEIKQAIAAVDSAAEKVAVVLGNEAASSLLGPVNEILLGELEKAEQVKKWADTPDEDRQAELKQGKAERIKELQEAANEELVKMQAPQKEVVDEDPTGDELTGDEPTGDEEPTGEEPTDYEDPTGDELTGDEPTGDEEPTGEEPTDYEESTGDEPTVGETPDEVDEPVEASTKKAKAK
jgi:hypothetical protein